MRLVLDLVSLLNKAIEAEYGIALRFSHSATARYQRRRLYAEREKLRRAGQTQYDDLSMVLRSGDRELLIVRRTALPAKREVRFTECRPLSSDELPEKVLSRGKSRAGVCIT